MLTISGVVTFAGELESKKKPGSTYRLVNIDGLRVFPVRELSVLPAAGQHVEAVVGVDSQDGRDNFRLYSWR